MDTLFDLENPPVNKLVKVLKESNQDFEFYPTTDEMLRIVVDRIKGNSILDIGCGNAKLYRLLKNKDKNVNYYGIEKSEILINQLPAEVIILGTDFNNCTLIDKEVDNIFCNPPYSEFENWTIRILKEGCFENAFLVIPERWKENKEIQKAKEDSGAISEVLASMDFFNAERQARAKVDIVRFSKSKYYSSYINPFDLWFKETFGFEEVKDRIYDLESKEEKELENILVSAPNKIESLVNLYTNEMNRLYSSFKAICGLDVKTLQDIGVETRKIKESLKYKIEHTKGLYWRMVFNCLDEITSRLTYKAREELYSRFDLLKSVDFNVSNVKSVVIWVLKNASSLFDKQLVDLYKEFTTPDNVIKYKSNQRVFKRNEYYSARFDDPKSISHYCLSYRMIVDNLYFKESYSWKVEISERKAQTIVDDLSAIANNLGFEVVSKDIASSFGEKYYIMGKDRPLIEFKVYQNGNTHLKLDKDLIMAINVEVARLLGWVQNKSEVMTEFPEEYKDAWKYYGANFRYCIEKPDIKLLRSE